MSKAIYQMDVRTLVVSSILWENFYNSLVLYNKSYTFASFNTTLDNNLNQKTLKWTDIKNSNESIFNKLDTERLLNEFKNCKPEDETKSQESDEGDCTSSDSEENFNDKELARLLPRVKKKKYKSKNKHDSNRSQRQVSKGNNKDSNKAIGSLKLVSLINFIDSKWFY